MGATIEVGRRVPGASWGQVDDPASVGYTPAGLERARAYAELVGAGPVFVAVGGQCLAAWGDAARSSYIASIRKSVLALLFGRLARDVGLNLDITLGQLGVDDLDPLTPSEKRATIRHLLQGRSGVYLKAAAESPLMVAGRPTRGAHAPGEHFYYNNWDFNALGAIFEQLSGMTVFAAVEEWLARPLAMEDFGAGSGRYWFDPASRYGAYHLDMTARDLARIGLLVARGGRWGDVDVVPSDWIAEATSVQTPSARIGHSPAGVGVDLSYGYLWWIGPEDALSGFRFLLGLGNGGHILAVVPDLDLVVVHRGWGQAPYAAVLPLLGILVDGRVDAGEPSQLAQRALTERRRWRPLVGGASMPRWAALDAPEAGLAVDVPEGWVTLPPRPAREGEAARAEDREGWVGRTVSLMRRRARADTAMGEALADAAELAASGLEVEGVTPHQLPVGQAARICAVRRDDDAPLTAYRYWLIDGNDALSVQASTGAAGPQLADDIELLGDIAATLRIRAPDPDARPTGGSRPAERNRAFDHRWHSVVSSLPQWRRETTVPSAAAVAVTTAALSTFGCGARPDTVFAAASLTKPVVALAAAGLVADGSLDLDRPLCDYGVQVPTDDARGQRITARMALAHTSGLPALSAGPPTLRADPGSVWHYSGLGYLFLQAALEAITGTSLDDYVRESVFAPLGMANSALVWRDAFESRAAVGHNRRGEALELVRPAGAYASSSLRTTALDYGRFLQAMLDDEHRWLFEQQIAIDDALGWALGWGLEQFGDTHLAWHWGDDPGYKNFVVVAPDNGIAAAVFTNGDQGADPYTRVIQTLLPGEHPALQRLRRPTWLRAQAGTARPLAADDFADFAELLPDGDGHANLQSGDNVFGSRADSRWKMAGVEEGTPLACAAVRHHESGRAQLTWIAVAGPLRRRGLARSLIYSIARTLQLDTLTAVPNEPGARLLEACGFRPGDTPSTYTLTLNVEHAR